MGAYQFGRRASSIKLCKTWLRYLGYVTMPKCRFVLDESALSLDEVPESEREVILMALIYQLDALRISGESIHVMENWGAVECLGGENVAETMVHCRILDRDQSMWLLGLLDRCVAWDQSPAVEVDSEIVVDGRYCKGAGIVWAYYQAILQTWTAVVTAPHRFESGVHCVDKPSQSLPARVYFVASIGDHPSFFRKLYEWDDVPESEFFERATLAFPRLVFAENISFGRFRGTYRTLRPKVIFHLGRINDNFPEVYASANGMPKEISTRLGINVSMEGQTRRSERLMRLRDVEFRGRVHRCEWHSKIEPNRNRIHFRIIEGMADTKILIGIFHEHLAT